MHGCWVELPLCSGPESFAPPGIQGHFHRRRQFAVGANGAFQSGQFDAVREPERLAGRLAPSVPDAVWGGELSRIVLRPDLQLWGQPSKIRVCLGGQSHERLVALQESQLPRRVVTGEVDLPIWD